MVNGRFLSGPQTGLQRFGRLLFDAAKAAGLRAEVLAPAGTRDPRVDRQVPGPGGRLGGHVFEQVTLPALAGRRPVLSLANTAPIAAAHGIVTVHDCAPLVGPHWFRREMQAHARLVLAAARRADLVLTVSAQVAAELQDRGVRAPVSVIRQAVAPRFRPASDAEVAAVRTLFGLQRPYVLLVGWADPRKDAATAAAAHRLARQRREHDLVLVGTPRDVFAPVRIPAGDGIHVLSRVADENLCALLSGAAALVYPSRYEGFGVPPLEAWACGTPALVSDLPAVRESTRDRAVYLPAGDVDAWAAAMVTALDGGVAVPEPERWTYDDAARQLLDALGGGP